jgi:hypothetical protein
MKFSKIALFAIAFSLLGSFCMGMDDEAVSTSQLEQKQPTYQQPSTTSSTQSTQLLNKQKVIENFKIKFSSYVLRRNAAGALNILKQYKENGWLSLNDFKNLRMPITGSGGDNLLDYVLRNSANDSFLNVIKYMVEVLGLEIQASDIKNYFSGRARDPNYLGFNKQKKGIANYLKQTFYQARGRLLRF